MTFPVRFLQWRPVRPRGAVVGVATCLLVALAGCSSNSESAGTATLTESAEATETATATATETETGASTSSGSDSAGSDSASQTSASAAGAVPAQFSAFGTEPFWNVAVDGESMLYTGVDQPDRAMTGTRAGSGTEAVYTGSFEGTAFTLTVNPGNCHDGMSDNTYPYTVEFSYGEATMNGCAEDAS